MNDNLPKDKDPGLFGYSLLDHGAINLIEVMGDDLSIVNNARVSFDQTSEQMGEREKGLINYLMKNRHGTPFEAVVLKFKVKCPIKVAREWFRHRISSFNEVSTRYSKVKDEFYLPELENVRQQVGKPGAYTFETVSPEIAPDFINELVEVYDYAWDFYEKWLEKGVGKELVSFALPMGLYTSFIWTVNLRSFMNFASLRSDENAMYEIREYSKLAEQMVSEVVPITWEAFNEHGRIQP